MAKRDQFGCTGKSIKRPPRRKDYRLSLESNHKQPEGPNEKFTEKLINLYYPVYMDFPNAYDEHT